MASRPTPDPYAVLGVARTATDTEIRRAYREAMKAAHPDRGGDPEAAARINEAYAVLSDPTRRAALDPPKPRPAQPPKSPPPRATAPPRAPRAAPPPRRSWWPVLVVGLVGIGLISVVVAATTPRVDSGDDDSPFFLSAGDCVDVDQLVATDVPCDSARADGEVVSLTGDGTCPDGLAPVASGERVLCVDLYPVFEVEGCVSIEGNVVTPVECGPFPEGIVSGLADDPDDCPLGTSGAARLDDGSYVCVVIP